jgi:heme/copper-type cytochrome/quinol oxidase subunit 2
MMMDDRAQMGIGWLVILFVAVMAFGFLMWILLSPMFNYVFDFVNVNYVDTGKISQANYGAGQVVYYWWLALPIIIVFGLIGGYLLRSIYSRGY